MKTILSGVIVSSINRKRERKEKAWCDIQPELYKIRKLLKEKCDYIYNDELNEIKLDLNLCGSLREKIELHLKSIINCNFYNAKPNFLNKIKAMLWVIKYQNKFMHLHESLQGIKSNYEKLQEFFCKFTYNPEVWEDDKKYILYLVNELIKCIDDFTYKLNSQLV